MKLKTLLGLAVAALMATACSQSETEDLDTPKERVVTFTATIEQETRSVAGDDGTFYWAPGDEIGVLLNTGDLRKFTYEGTEQVTQATFKGTLSEGEEFGRYAVYPYDEKHKLIEEEEVPPTIHVNTEIGDTETPYAANTLAPMVATIEENTAITFTHVSGVLRFIINNVPSNVNGFQLIIDEVGSDWFGDQWQMNLDMAVSIGRFWDTISTKTYTIKFKNTTTQDMTFYVPVITETSPWESAIQWSPFEIRLLEDSEVVAKKAVTTGPYLNDRTMVKYAALDYSEIKN